VARGANAAAFPNPTTGDFADPFVLRGAGEYYAFATGANRLHLQVARSRDLGAWTLLGEALPELPAWALKAPGLTWAPSALARRDRYVLYYTTADTVSGYQCISRALASSPEGPYFDDSSRPLVCQVAGNAAFCGSIDPSPFLDSDGRPYLLWKSDENSARCRTAPRLWAQALTDDGLNLVGSAQMLLAVDQRWEDTIIEAPSLVRHGDRYLLFYSGNRYDSGDYAIGYATCPNLFGLCTKVSLGAPYLSSVGARIGPGGQELFEDANGAVWMAYHAWTSPKTSYGAGGLRSLRLLPMSFGPGGEPRPMIAP
jgi:beta-xylosidase